jgi:hypothetical protein
MTNTTTAHADSRTDLRSAPHHPYVTGRPDEVLNHLREMRRGDVPRATATSRGFSRSVKEEEVWLNEYQNFDQATLSIARRIEEYNHDCQQRGLYERTPHEFASGSSNNPGFKHGPMSLVLIRALRYYFGVGKTMNEILSLLLLSITAPFYSRDIAFQPSHSWCC